MVVVHHDPVLHVEGGAGGPTRRIADLAAADLARFPLVPGVPLPTLQEALDAIGDRATVYVEIKAANIEPLVVRCIRESDAGCAVHSFDHRIVLNVKKIFPAIRCGVLQVARHVDPVASLVATGAEDLWQHVDYIDEDLVSRAHAIGASVVAWTANDPTLWRGLYAIGVDALCTDLVGELAAGEW